MSKERELLQKVLDLLPDTKGARDGEPIENLVAIVSVSRALDLCEEIEAYFAAEEEHEHEHEHEHEYVGKGSRPDHWRCIHCGKIIRREDSP